MLRHSDLSSADLRAKLKRGELTFGGNARLKIYGTLHCQSGQRLTKANRVFFTNEQEAIDLGYRPCGHCLREKYKLWKSRNSNLNHEEHKEHEDEG